VSAGAVPGPREPVSPPGASHAVFRNPPSPPYLSQIVFYDYDRYSADDKAFHFWFHTGFVYNNYLLLHKDVIDRACKDKGAEFDADFKVEVFLEELDEDVDLKDVGAAVEDDRDDPAGDDEEEAAGGGAAAASAASAAGAE